MSSVLFTFEPLDDYDGDDEDELIPGLAARSTHLEDGIVEQMAIFRDPDALDAYLDDREAQSAQTR